MGHVLLLLYLVTGLFGRGGVVLCVEENSSLIWESLFKSCCDQRDDVHSQQAHEEESDDFLCPGECPCVDLPASWLIQQRLDGAASMPVIPALLPCIGQPTPAARLVTEGKHRYSAWPADRNRPDLPGAGTAPLILRT